MSSDYAQRQDRARAFVRSCGTADELVKQLKAMRVDHPSGLAQLLGVPGRGSSLEVAEAILRRVEIDGPYVGRQVTMMASGGGTVTFRVHDDPMDEVHRFPLKLVTAVHGEMATAGQDSENCGSLLAELLRRQNANQDQG